MRADAPDRAVNRSGRKVAAALAAAAALLASMAGSGVAFARPAHDGYRPSQYQEVAALYEIDPALLRAIAAVESGGDPWAVSPKGAAGLMQLMPATAREFRVGNRFDSIDSLLGAARFLDWLRTWARTRRSFKVSLPALIAAYNAGPRAVARYHGVPPYPETRHYVRRVLLAYLLGLPQTPGESLRSRARPLVSQARVCHRNCDRRWLSELQRIRMLRARANTP